VSGSWDIPAIVGVKALPQTLVEIAVKNELFGVCCRVSEWIVPTSEELMIAWRTLARNLPSST
jgi:hypothetical protein